MSTIEVRLSKCEAQAFTRRAMYGAFAPPPSTLMVGNTLRIEIEMMQRREAHNYVEVQQLFWFCFLSRDDGTRVERSRDSAALMRIYRKVLRSVDVIRKFRLKARRPARRRTRGGLPRARKE